MKTKTGNRPYVIVRAHTAGVHAGYLESRDGTDVVLTNSRRLWKWCGGSLSEVATYGPSLKGENKFGALVVRTTIVSPQGLEIAECTEEARKAIEAIPEWRR
jgi:hypothetical protein